MELCFIQVVHAGCPKALGFLLQPTTMTRAWVRENKKETQVKYTPRRRLGYTPRRRLSCEQKCKSPTPVSVSFSDAKRRDTSPERRRVLIQLLWGQTLSGRVLISVMREPEEGPIREPEEGRQPTHIGSFCLS
jgi:hypothetical protein